MKLLITGCKGQLGRAIAEVNKDKHELKLTDIDTLDITSYSEIEKIVDSFNPDIIVNCAAYTDVEGAENNRELAFKLNSEAPLLLAKGISTRGGKLIHISTDYVFGDSGINRPLQETDSKNPQNVYGESKYKGEFGLLENYPDNTVIIRTSWLYSPWGKNFVKTMIGLLRDREIVKVVEDQIGTPTSALDLARAILSIIERADLQDLSGVFHFSNRGVCSWYDFAESISELTLGVKAEINPCRSDEFPSKVKRPSYSVLDKTKISELLPYKIPYWKQSLKEVMMRISDAK